MGEIVQPLEYIAAAIVLCGGLASIAILWGMILVAEAIRSGREKK